LSSPLCFGFLGEFPGQAGESNKENLGHRSGTIPTRGSKKQAVKVRTTIFIFIFIFIFSR
jgi:hypothetical protein